LPRGDETLEYLAEQASKGNEECFVMICRTLGETFSHGKRAYPKNCVNDQKMVKIPRERKWSWHERRKRKKRILSTNC
jgi:hypothetical protein